jgi:hypothetical protein
MEGLQKLAKSYQILKTDKVARSPSESSPTTSNPRLRRENTGPGRTQSIECTGQFVLTDKKTNLSKEGDKLTIAHGVLRLHKTAAGGDGVSLMLGSFCDVTYAADARTGGGIVSFHKPSADLCASDSYSSNPYATNSTSSLGHSTASNAHTGQASPVASFCSQPTAHTLTMLRTPDLSVHNPNSADPAWDLFVAISVQHLVRRLFDEGLFFCYC